MTSNIDSIEQFFEGEPRESSSKINLLSKTHQDNKTQNLDHDLGEPGAGMAKVLAINLLHAWKHDTSIILFSLRNSLLLIYKTCKLYILTLLFLGIYIPIFFSLGGILLIVFLLLLGFLPVFGGMLIVPLLISTAVTGSASIGWYVGIQIIENFRQSPWLSVAVHLCDRVKRFHPGTITKMKNVLLNQFKIVPAQQEQVDNNSHLDRWNNESSGIKHGADHGSQHNIEVISQIQNERNQEQLSVNSLTDLHTDWDDIDENESSVIYYSFSEIEDNDIEAIANERSSDISPRISDDYKSKEGYPDLGIDRIQKLKCTRDILSEMKRHSKPHIFQ